jgi:peptide deformylase
MAILKIHVFPDPVLRQKAEPVEKFDAELGRLADDMLETMYDAPGVGLAANQVGALKRLLVLDVDYSIEGEDENDRKYIGKNPRVIVNPRLLARSGEIIFKEGCLSVPGFTETVERNSHVKFAYQDAKGKPHELEADGLLAVAIQHEMDHLDGKLFIDRLSMAKRSLIKGKLKKERSPRFEKSRLHVEL